MTKPAVLGGGSWGTALSLVLARRGFPINLWVHNPGQAEEMSRSRLNAAYLPGFALPENVSISSNLQVCVERASLVVFAVPSHALRSVASAIKPHLAPNSCLVSASKGIEQDSLCRMSQVLQDVCGRPGVVALSGPSFAREVAEAMPTAVVAASADAELAQNVQQAFSSSRFRIYASTDVCGVELGGAMKNVIAIAAGVCHGLNLGQNAVAALVTRGLAEMSRLAKALGAQPGTLAGLSGLGDLMLTCTGELSRNRQVGVRLAQGLTLDAILLDMQSVAEGVKTTKSVVELGRRENVSLPICEQMHAVLYEGQSPIDAIQILMERSLKGE